MTIILIVVVILLNTILQSTLIPYIGVFDVVPNTAIAIVALISIKKGRFYGSVSGFSAGLLQDVMFSAVIGINAFILFFLGYLIGFAHNSFTRETAVYPFVFTAMGTIFYNLVFALIQFFLSRDIVFIDVVKRIFSLEIMYNGVVAVVLFIIMQKVFDQPNLRFGRR